MFANRTTAGRELAERLIEYAGDERVIVLALPRGGVPVAAEISSRLGAPLDVLPVRKLGVPGHPELAMGAIAPGGVEVLSYGLIRELGLPDRAVRKISEREQLELERRSRAYRGDRPSPGLKGRIVILVDDGLATGSTMEAAVWAVRKQEPSSIVVAVPVGARDTCERIGRIADRIVCLAMPEPFTAVGQWYQDFSQTTDEEVSRLMVQMSGD